MAARVELREAEELEAAAQEGADELREYSARLLGVADAASKVIVGRRDVVEAEILALILGQHIWLVGPPGTGKSATRLVAETCGFSFAYHLFTPLTTPEDFALDVVVRKSREADGSEVISTDYRLKRGGFGEAEVFFADELDRASGAVLNLLLGPLAGSPGRRFISAGEREFAIPLRTVVAASNRAPDHEALFDRFLFRVWVRYLDPSMWTQYLVTYLETHRTGADVRSLVGWRPAEVREAVEWASRNVERVDAYGLLDDYAKAMMRIRERGIEVSDRRLGRTLNAVRAAALMRGSLVAEPQDLTVLMLTIPRNPDESEVVAKVLGELLGEFMKVGEELSKAAAQLREVERGLGSMSVDDIVRLLKYDLPRAKRLASGVTSPSLARRAEELAELIGEVERQAVDALARKLVE